jgi:hypothetical protein
MTGVYDEDAMFLLDFALSFFVALAVSVLFAMHFRHRGISASFVIVLLGAWAGGVWLIPVGPPIRGIHLAPFFLVGLIVAMLLAIPANTGAPRTTREAIEESDGTVSDTGSSDAFFWLLICLLGGSIIIHYL